MEPTACTFVASPETQQPCGRPAVDTQFDGRMAACADHADHPTWFVRDEPAEDD